MYGDIAICDGLPANVNGCLEIEGLWEDESAVINGVFVLDRRCWATFAEKISGNIGVQVSKSDLRGGCRWRRRAFGEGLEVQSFCVWLTWCNLALQSPTIKCLWIPHLSFHWRESNFISCIDVCLWKLGLGFADWFFFPCCVAQLYFAENMILSFLIYLAQLVYDLISLEKYNITK